MTALPDGVRSVVLIERHDNVVYVDFQPETTSGQDYSPWWSRAAGPAEAVPGETLTATRALPARWSPRPLRVLGDRLARSQYAADLRRRALYIGFLIGFLAFVGLVDLALLLSPASLATGGTP